MYNILQRCWLMLRRKFLWLLIRLIHFCFGKTIMILFKNNLAKKYTLLNENSYCSNIERFLAAKSSSRNDGVNILLIMLTYLFTCMFTDIFTSRELTQTHVFNMLEYMFTCKVMYITTFVLHKNGTKNCK